MSFIGNGEVYFLLRTWNHLDKIIEEYQGKKSGEKKVIKNFKQIGGKI